MDSLQAADHEKILNVLLMVQGLFSFAFLICSFVVAGTATMGFNVILTALLCIAFIGGTYHVLNNSKKALSVGFAIGVALMMTFLFLETAIFWGEISKYDNTSANKATCAFATLLFILQTAFVSLLILWKDEFVTDSGSSTYDDLNGTPGSFGNMPPSNNNAGGSMQPYSDNYNNQGNSTVADL
jgi:hypothetical protein